MAQLPICSIIPELQAALRRRAAVILSAPTGSGKTTAVPPALLGADWLRGRRILMLEPRRLAARMAAQRMADVMAEPVGRTVGYRVRFDSRVSAATRIEVLTEGILTRRLQSDPALEDVGLVIFDEFHERSIHADLGLALCLDVMAGLRDDLKILVMSATLDIENLAGLLAEAAVVSGGGRSFPVAVRYLGDYDSTYASRKTVGRMVAAIRQAVVDEQGDILAFLPGEGEIRHTGAELAAWAAGAGLLVRPLYGNLTRKQQDEAVLPAKDGRRRIILATSIAETSLTIEGVRLVIDSGWSRGPRFDPDSGLSRLSTRRVSRAAAEQRRGRAGRLGPGLCLRLWSEALNPELPEHSQPEILAADLAPLALDLALWGVADPAALKWLNPPPAGHYRQAVELLTILGALDFRGGITRLGRRMAELPVHPRLARMLVAAEAEGGLALACDLAALLSERDIITDQGDRGAVDIEERLKLLAAYRQAGKNTAAFDAGGAGSAGARVIEAARQCRRLLHGGHGGKGRPGAGALLARAYPDRIGQLRPASRSRYLLAGGRGAVLPEADALAGTPYLVAAHLDAGRIEGRIYFAAAITGAELCQRLADKITIVEKIAWDAASEAVVACREERLFELVLDRRPLSAPEPEAIKEAMLEGIRRLGLEALPWTREARDLQTRILSLRFWQPDEAWPDVSNAALHQEVAGWLGPYLYGISRRQHLTRLDLAGILRNMLSRDQQGRLEREAPSHIRVPSGSRLPLRYCPGEPPVLAVRLQELFGLADTPRVSGGRIKIMLHLLSPAHRPVQVTQDLRGFWDSTYREVKKELKGRYPKHHWPDDPWAAEPTAGTKKKIT